MAGLPLLLCRTACLENPGVLNKQLRTLATASAALPLSSASRTKDGDDRHASSSRWLPAAAAAGTVAIVGAVAAIGASSIDVKGDAPRSSSAAAGDIDEQVAAMKKLHEWLVNQGADLSKVEVKPSKAGPGAGLGIFSTAAASSRRTGAPWWSWIWPQRGVHSGVHCEPTTLASFPLDAAITVRTACNDLQVGEQFSWMLDKHLLDERTAVMVYLLIEKLRGDKSRFAPWIEALPRTFDVPITYTDQDLAEIRGTALHRATATMMKRLRETWSRLEAPLGAVARDLGLPSPRWEDWVWAYCVFWSRGQSLPVPESGSASSALVGHSSNGSDKIPIQILEGLVPGLDFCNHRLNPSPQCWWEVVAPDRPKAATAAGSTSSLPLSKASGRGSASAATSPSPSGPIVQLQLHSGVHVQVGEELYISYGDKSNEELLMLYGFALEDNPHDQLMLFCPLPPRTEWDDVMYARMELLQAYGLRPQFFLPHPDQVSVMSPAGMSKRGKACRKAVTGRKAGAAAAITAAAASGSMSATTDDADGSDAASPAPPLELPAEVLDTLEVFVLSFQELAVRSKMLQANMEKRRAARTAGSPLAAMSQHSPVLDLAALRSRYERMAAVELRHYLQALGLRMATLTTFVRLLEMKVDELEGNEGTGLLEEDERLLRSLAPTSTAGAAAPQPVHNAARAVDREQQKQQDVEQQRDRRLRAALIYRVGQKRLARAWLVRAKGELRNLLALMRDMQSQHDSLDRGQQS